ncbi:MAG: hypothetical protein SGPRY_008174 [Prymnesium sp.]
MVHFSPSITYLAASRRIPFEPALASQSQLDDEYVNTRAFEGKQLKADPRLKPEGMTVSYDHLHSCSSCEQSRTVHNLQHAHNVSLAGQWQLLVDDFAIHSWRNVIRSLRPPSNQRPVLSPSSLSHTRFGCPCSVLREKQGGYRLYHASGATAGNESRYKEWPAEYMVSFSSNGIDGWGRSSPVSLDGYISSASLTGSLTVEESSDPQTGERRGYFAGYEGANSRVCLARSTDGMSWQTLPTDSKPAASRMGSRKKSRPPHLAAAFRKRMAELVRQVNLRKAHIRRACAADIKRCIQMGARYRRWWGNLSLSGAPKGFRVSACILQRYYNGTLSPSCAEGSLLTLRESMAQTDCVDGTHSALGRAGDCNIQLLYDKTTQRQLVWYRRDFGTAGGWREIRGVQVASVGPHLRTSGAVTPLEVEHVKSYYLDRLGKLERYRRQIYSVTFTQQSESLWLGLMTLIEWAKDGGELEGAQMPAFERDTTSIYLVTSRDGLHIDDEWVYARQPLIRKARLQGEWNSGFQLAASSIVSDAAQTFWRVYFEARELRHEDRFKKTGVIGVAHWDYQQMVGLRTADHTHGPGMFTTKRFSLKGNRLQMLLNVDTEPSHCGNASLQVEIVDEDEQPLRVEGRGSAMVVKDVRSTSFQVKWNTASSVSPETKLEMSTPIIPGAYMRARFKLTGTAQLFAFRILAL